MRWAKRLMLRSGRGTFFAEHETRVVSSVFACNSRSYAATSDPVATPAFVFDVSAGTEYITFQTLAHDYIFIVMVDCDETSSLSIPFCCLPPR